MMAVRLVIWLHFDMRLYQARLLSLLPALRSSLIIATWTTQDLATDQSADSRTLSNDFTADGLSRII